MFCISIPQVNPNMLSCSISRPCTSEAQGYSVRSLKSAHLHSDTWSLCATLTLFVPLLQNPHSLILSWRVSDRAVPIFPELLFLQCAWSPINIRTTEKQEEDAVWAEDAFLAEDAWMATLLFHQASSTHRPTPAAWQTQTQIIHNWNIHWGAWHREVLE